MKKIIGIIILCVVLCISCDELKGPVGPQGERGERGYTGAKGPQGEQGLRGDRGENFQFKILEGRLKSENKEYGCWVFLFEIYTRSEIIITTCIGIEEEGVLVWLEPTWMWAYNKTNGRGAVIIYEEMTFGGEFMNVTGYKYLIKIAYQE